MNLQLGRADRFTLSETAQALDRHVSTIWRWTFRGVRGHRLPTVLIGGRRFVMRCDLEAFLRALNSAPTDLPATQERAVPKRVDAELDVAGI